MKYKSELIHEILEQRGHEKSSLHYQSECVESWVDETKGAYPKLCDYESEWLNYISENPIGEFPYETVTTNNTATVNHVVPFEYKSAILKGNSQRVISSTKNLFDGELEQGTIDSYGNNVNLTTSIRSKNFVEIGVNTTFTLSRKKATGSLGFRCYDKNKNYLGTIFRSINAGILNKTYTTDSVTVYIRFIDNTNDLTNQYQIEIGSTATDYEEPSYVLKSVKMPVLTTTGKNLFDKTKIIFNKLIDLNTGIISDDSVTNITDFIKVIPNTQYTMSFNFTTNAWTRCFGLTEPKQGKYATDVNGKSNKCYFDSNSKTITFTTSPTTKYLIFTIGKGVEESFQLEQGSTATSYEPHKSNILTVNEDVTLRSNGDVYDELNLLTGRLTQRIDENNEVLAQAVVKTVELTVVNQDGEPLSKIKPIEGTMHIEVSGTPINPTAVLEVPVEAIAQNLNSFIEEE